MGKRRCGNQRKVTSSWTVIITLIFIAGFAYVFHIDSTWTERKTEWNTKRYAEQLTWYFYCVKGEPGITPASVYTHVIAYVCPLQLLQQRVYIEHQLLCLRESPFAKHTVTIIYQQGQLQNKHIWTYALFLLSIMGPKKNRGQRLQNGTGSWKFYLPVKSHKQE